jgi:phosphoribosyl 1,2-cyclic phosphodiesterase
LGETDCEGNESELTAADNVAVTTTGGWLFLRQPLEHSGGELELLVITHVDGDHITGILELIEKAGKSVKPKDVWFNGFRHLPNEDPETLGPVQGEKLTDFLVNHRVPWNIAFDKEAAVVPEYGELPRLQLAGGLTLTLLSPTVQCLRDLRASLGMRSP